MSTKAKDRCLHRMLRSIAGRGIAIGFLAVALAAAVVCILRYSNTVYITDGDRSIQTVTVRKDLRTVLAVEGVYYTANDALTVTSLEGRGRQQAVNVERAFPVYLTVDDATVTCYLRSGTVQDLLDLNSVVLGPLDTVSHELDTVLTGEEEIVVTRVESHTRIEKETIYKGIDYKSTSLLKNGKTRTLSTGWNGTRVYTYEDIIENDEIVDSILVNTTISTYPQNDVVLLGDGSTISRLDYSDEFPLDENGNPINYKYVLHNQAATGYYARAGAWGAAVYSAARNMPDIGPCIAGTVAIRPEEIPYGTKMYIKSADGSFVYGYAIANDTGTGLQQNLIDVDLFYESYLESALNGRRIVDIYILE